MSWNGISMTSGRLIPQPPLVPTVRSQPENVVTSSKLGDPERSGEKYINCSAVAAVPS
ncbi:hypothetical protein ACP6C7_31585 [Mycolicibacterium septicum]|uniref:Uncharacterized protein n=1 Tax=Mycolicibacterium septicum TaxID=98668 RepID=A0ABW9M4B0_9MYCO